MTGPTNRDPYYRPPGLWDRPHVGTDIYQVPTNCPYCGHRARCSITGYEGVWFKLQCPECGEPYKVRSRVKERKK